MPRDDLSIDFVHKMAPSVEAQDPGLILDDWVHRTSNLHEEIRFLQDEIHDKDRAYHDCVKTIEDSDGKIQRWIRANGSAQPNPREDFLRNTIQNSYTKADQLALEKMRLSARLSQLLEKHMRHLDGQIKILYDRAEPGFTNPDETPSILRPSAANHSIPSTKYPNAAAASPMSIAATNSTPSTRVANPQVRTTQAHVHGSSSAPVTPAATIILNRKDRQSSADPVGGAPKRGPRTNPALGNAPANSSGLARHSSIGPGTPKAGTPGTTSRAGSVGPRGVSKSNGSIRKGTPSGVPSRKKPPNAKSGLNRVKQAGRSKGSPTSTADSELSDAESASSPRAGSRAGSGTPAPSAATSHLPHKRFHKHPGGGGGGGGDDDMADSDADGSGSGEEEDEEGKKYCLCQHVSYGDMVACDNPDCPYEWFHWNCVGLKSEPEGRWFCPECREQRKKAK